MTKTSPTFPDSMEKEALLRAIIHKTVTEAMDEFQEYGTDNCLLLSINIHEELYAAIKDLIEQQDVLTLGEGEVTITRSDDFIVAKWSNNDSTRLDISPSTIGAADEDGFIFKYSLSIITETI